MTHKSKNGAITQQEKNKVKQSASSLLDTIKANNEEMIMCVIDSKTTIELPASMPESQRDERIYNYKIRHKIKM